MKTNDKKGMTGTMKNCVDEEKKQKENIFATTEAYSSIEKIAKFITSNDTTYVCTF